MLNSIWTILTRWKSLADNLPKAIRRYVVHNSPSARHEIISALHCLPHNLRMGYATPKHRTDARQNMMVTAAHIPKRYRAALEAQYLRTTQRPNGDMAKVVVLHRRCRSGHKA